MNWQHLDAQMKAFSARLTSEVKLTPLETTLLSLVPKCCHRTTSVLSICRRHVFIFSRRYARAAPQRKSVLNSSATIPCALFETQSPTPIGHTGLISGPSSIGRARAVIRMRPYNSLRLSKTTFRFGKPLAGASRMPLTPTCKAGYPGDRPRFLWPLDAARESRTAPVTTTHVPSPNESCLPRTYQAPSPGYGGQSPKCPGLCPSLRVLRSHIGIRPQNPAPLEHQQKNHPLALVK